VTKNPFWLDRHAGDSIRFFDQVYTLKASGDQIGGSFGLVEVSTPEGSCPPPHVHEREDELFYVLEGTYEVTVGEESFEAEGGWVIFAPLRIPHGYVVRTDRPGTWASCSRAVGRRSSMTSSEPWGNRPRTRRRLPGWRWCAASPCSALRLDRRCVPTELWSGRTEFADPLAEPREVLFVVLGACLADPEGCFGAELTDVVPGLEHPSPG
jgi:quercetin dioxygenase-like cupin family protein